MKRKQILIVGLIVVLLLSFNVFNIFQIHQLKKTLANQGIISGNVSWMGFDAKQVDHAFERIYAIEDYLDVEISFQRQFKLEKRKNK